MDSMCALCLRASGPKGAGEDCWQDAAFTGNVQGGLKTATKPARHSAAAEGLFYSGNDPL